MTQAELRNIIANGETSAVEFKRDNLKPKALPTNGLPSRTLTEGTF